MFLQKVISRKTGVLKLVFVGVSKVNNENSRIRIRRSGSGSTPKCHGSGTLVKIIPEVAGAGNKCA
jgi:hypothetical protein